MTLAKKRISKGLQKPTSFLFFSFQHASHFQKKSNIVSRNTVEMCVVRCKGNSVILPYWKSGTKTLKHFSFTFRYLEPFLTLRVNTGCLQKNGAVSKINKKFISHLTRAKRTPSAAATVQVSHALRAVRFSCLMRGCGASFQDGVAAGKGFVCSVLRCPDL